MNIADQIIEAEYNYLGTMGENPKSIYLGKRQWYELMHSEDYQIENCKRARPVAAYIQDTFRGMNVYRLNTEDHIRVA
jgi:hypothetical protein